MTAYISRKGAQKKRNILNQRVLELVGEIRREASTARIEKRAERVRQARLSLIKALNHEIEPARAEDEATCKTTLKHLHEDAEKWQAAPLEEIIDHYAQPDIKTEQIYPKKW